MFRMKTAAPPERDEQAEKHLRLVNMVANTSLTAGLLSHDHGKVIVYAEFDRAEFESRTGITFPIKENKTG